MLPNGTVEQRYLDVPQTQLIREYFRTANGVDIHNQYRQGILAVERTWKTKSWNLRLFQTVMGKVLVNGFLAFKFKTSKSPCLRDFTNVVAQALCEDEAEKEDYEVAERTRAQKQAKTTPSAVAPPSQRIKHALVRGSSIDVGGKRNQGPCKLCKDQHASGVCVTCSEGLDTDNAKPFWLCAPGQHGRQCYFRHLTEMLTPSK